jgi:uncharacterized phage-associated protein
MKVLYEGNRLSVRLLRRLIFENRCEGWKNGPVYVDLWRNPDRYESTDTLAAVDKEILRFVTKKLGKATGAQLSARSHDFPEWIESRSGLSDSDLGNRPITFATIRKAISQELHIEGDGKTVCIPNPIDYASTHFEHFKSRAKELALYQNVLKLLLHL